METELLNPESQVFGSARRDLLSTAGDMLSGMDFRIFKYLINLLEGLSEIEPPITFVLYGPPRSGKSFLLNKLRMYVGDEEERVAWALDWSSSFSECAIHHTRPTGFFQHLPLKDIPRDRIAVIHLTKRDGELEELMRQSVGRNVHVINFTKLY
jgi:KAP family P-loop domain